MGRLPVGADPGRTADRACDQGADRWPGTPRHALPASGCHSAGTHPHLDRAKPGRQGRHEGGACLRARAKPRPANEVRAFRRPGRRARKCPSAAGGRDDRAGPPGAGQAGGPADPGRPLAPAGRAARDRGRTKQDPGCTGPGQDVSRIAVDPQSPCGVGCRLRQAGQRPLSLFEWRPGRIASHCRQRAAAHLRNRDFHKIRRPDGLAIR